MKTSEINLSDFTLDDRGASELSRYVEVLGYIKDFTAEKDAIAQRLKLELQNNPDAIIDGEHQLVATLKERAGAPTFDLISMSQKDASLVVEAARLGLLKVQTEAARKQKGQSAAADALLNKYAMPGPSTFALIVEKA
jgi:hypothetical protein